MNEIVTIKAISLWQPWASLVAVGAKEYETRSWYTSYRGPLLVQAAKRWTIEEQMACYAEPFFGVLTERGFSTVELENMPRGCALALVDLTDVYRTEDVRGGLSAQELAFGNYADGRFAWKLENRRWLASPIPMVGHQGLWNQEIAVDILNGKAEVR